MVKDDYSQEDFVLKDEAFFHSRKHITWLFKRFLNLLENIKNEHDINYSKLYKAIPEQKDLLEMADYLDQRKLSNLRKQILDIGNDSIRNLEQDIKNL